MTCDDGSEHETSDEHLYRLQEPKSELLPDMASPPAIATPPPAPPSAPLGGAPGATPGRLHEPAPPPTAHGTAALAAGGAAPPPFAASKPPAGAGLCRAPGFCKRASKSNAEVINTRGS